MITTVIGILVAKKIIVHVDHNVLYSSDAIGPPETSRDLRRKEGQ